MEISERKYNQLLQVSTTRILPDGICNGTTCRMQLNRCLKCEHFESDANYSDHFRVACSLLEEQIKKAPSDNLKAQVKRRLMAYRKFLELTDSE